MLASTYLRQGPLGSSDIIQSNAKALDEHLLVQTVSSPGQGVALNMSLQFQIVWAILVVEVIAVLLLILPVSLRLKHHAIRYLSSSNRIQSLWYALRVAFVVILLLFVGT